MHIGIFKNKMLFHKKYKHVKIRFLTVEIIIIMIIINRYNFSGPRLSLYIEKLKH